MRSRWAQLQNNRLTEIADSLANRVHSLIEDHSTKLLVLSLVISIAFSVIRTVFYHGYNVDSYQYYALSLEKWLTTGTEDYLFHEYYARSRIMYPLILALAHHVIPIDISILACSINLLFALGTIAVLRDLLNLRGFSKAETNLCSVLVIMSYGFLNYWFSINTDMAGLFFFMLMLYYAMKYLTKNSYQGLILSIVSLLFSVLCREIYILGVVLYLWILLRWANRNGFRVFLAACAITEVALILALNSALITGLLAYVIPPLYRPEFESGQYIQLIILLQQKWFIESYALDFFKGLFKVGILPASVILLFLILGEEWNRSQRGRRIVLRVLAQLQKDIVFLWMIVFFLTFTFAYSNIYSPSGLRYWLPISWIPLIYVSRKLYRDIDNRTLKTLAILFLALYPIIWSSGEWYTNRNAPSGTGPLVSPNYYVNDMYDLVTIRRYDRGRISVTLLETSQFNSTLTLPNETVQAFSFGFLVWLNMTRGATIVIKLRSPNHARFGLELYAAYKDFSSGWNESMFKRSNIWCSSQLGTYEFTVNQPFLLRYIELWVEGGDGAQIIWDKLEVTVY